MIYFFSKKAPKTEFCLIFIFLVSFRTYQNNHFLLSAGSTLLYGLFALHVCVIRGANQNQGDPCGLARGDTITKKPDGDDSLQHPAYRRRNHVGKGTRHFDLQEASDIDEVPKKTLYEASEQEDA